MDDRNRFDGRGTFLLMRLEALGGLLATVGLALVHLAEIRFPAFAALFLSIDLLGYLPGAIAHRLARGRPVSRVYHALYNTTHSFLWNGLVALAWWMVVGPEWALLALPIHLLGDRALFGNFFKPFVVPFVATALPAFVRFEEELRRPLTGAES